jgi:uncharacterized protein involved in exopolysaccharide biosynthesis
MSDRLSSSSTDQSSSPDEISLAESVARFRRFLELCWTSRARFVRAWAIATLAAVVYVLGTAKEYTVTTKILPYKSDKGALGSLGGLAGLAGINIPIGMSDQVVPSELYPEVANSFAFRQELSVQPIHFTNGVFTYSSYFDSVYTLSPFQFVKKYVLFAPLTAYGAIRESSSGATAGGATSLRIDSLGLRQYSVAEVQRIDEMKARVTTGINKKTGIISIVVTMPDQLAAADLARLATERLASEIIRYESQKASEQARFLGEQQSLAESRYRQAQARLAEFQDRNRTLGAAVPMAELQRLQSDFTLASELYRSITAQYEAAVVKKQEDTPVLTVLEPSVVPNRPSSPRKARTLLLLLVLGTLVVLVQLVAVFVGSGSELAPGMRESRVS